MTLRTVSGIEIDLAAPEHAAIALGDVAHALSQLCRFGGHTSAFWSVASHSVLVSEIAEAALADLAPLRRRAGAALALLHDASEAYLGDVVTPLKRLPILTLYGALEARWQAALVEWFALVPASQDGVLQAAVAAADARALRIERRDFQGVAGEDAWPRLAPQRPLDARRVFLERAAALGLE